MSKLVINLAAGSGIVERSEETKRFLKEMRKYPTLTKDDERYWFTVMNSGDSTSARENARKYIIMCNQRFVFSVAKKYATADNLMDYVNEGNIGLMEAVSDFDVSKDVKFMTFAVFYIKRAINAYRNGSLQVVKKPNRSKTFHVISKAKNDFLQENERDPTLQELFDIINNKYKKNIKDPKDLLDFKYDSIDGDVSDEDDSRGIGTMTEFNNASSNVNDAEVHAEQAFREKLVRKYLRILGKREQLIVKMTFGMYDDNGVKRPMESREVGERLGLTQERIRQIMAESIRKMREEYKRELVVAS